MIYSRFGTPLKLLSKHQETDGRLSILGTAGEAPDVRQYNIADMSADGGAAEIQMEVAKLPWSVARGTKGKPSRRYLL